MGLIIYLVLTAIAGLIMAIIGAVMMRENWHYGFKDSDVQTGAFLFAAGSIGPITLPLALVAGVIFGLFKAYEVMTHIYNEFKESK